MQTQITQIQNRHTHKSPRHDLTSAVERIRSLMFSAFSPSCQQTSAGAVELSDIKQMKTPPPLPPKPEHGLLKSHSTATDGTLDTHCNIHADMKLFDSSRNTRSIMKASECSLFLCTFVFVALYLVFSEITLLHLAKIFFYCHEQEFILSPSSHIYTLLIA